MRPRRTAARMPFTFSETTCMTATTVTTTGGGLAFRGAATYAACSGCIHERWATRTAVMPEHYPRNTHKTQLFLVDPARKRRHRVLIHGASLRRPTTRLGRRLCSDRVGQFVGPRVISSDPLPLGPAVYGRLRGRRGQLRRRIRLLDCGEV